MIFFYECFCLACQNAYQAKKLRKLWSVLYCFFDFQMFMKGFYTILLLIFSNVFMTLAWYGHLRFAEWKWFSKMGLFMIIVVSWGIAFFEYCLIVPANKMGFVENGGPFNLWQLKVIQEVISLIIFTLFVIFVFKTDGFRWNHLVGFLFLILAVYFIFKK